MTNETREYFKKIGIVDSRMNDLFKGIDEMHNALTRMDYTQRAMVKNAGGIQEILNNVSKTEGIAEIKGL